MKKLFLICFICFLNLSLLAQNPFITTWEITSDNESITIPTTGEGYNYSVDWGDDTSDSNLNGNATHEYSTAGTYTVSISGDFPRIFFSNIGDKDKIYSIEQWGDIQWTSMESAFYGCSNLILNASDVPDLSNVTNLSKMFSEAAAFTGDLSLWDVSTITNMEAMFSGATSFNGDLSDWDVSSVNNMNALFANYSERSSSFNSDLSSWDVGNVTDMGHMFYKAISFNGDISMWDVSKVTNMRYMFYTTDIFNGDLSSWDVSSVLDMHYMFDHAISFNGNLNSWDVSNVADVSGMFSAATSFNGDLSDWNLESVTEMDYMFSYASSFNGDLSSWDVSNVTSMNSMFFGASSFNSDISGWDVSNVLQMYKMFSNASSFNRDLSSWNVSSVSNMSNMFKEANSFNGDLSSWDVSNVTDMSYMFISAYSFNGDLSQWDVSNVTDMTNMFAGAISFNHDLGSWDVSSVSDMTNIFDNTALSVENYDNILNGWAAIPTLQNDVEFGVETLIYCEAEEARNTLINDYGWNLTGDTKNCGFQSISFEPIEDKTYGNDDFELNAIASSGLEVLFTSSNQEVITINGNIATIVGAGTTTIIASQEGDEKYDAAESVAQELVVNKADQTITFEEIEHKIYGVDDFELIASTTSTLSLTYISSNEEVATINDNIVSILGAGTTTITASQEGNENYDAAESITQELIVNKADQTITFDAIEDKVYGDDDFELNASTTSGLTVSFKSSNQDVITINGILATIVGEGTTAISASQEGNENYNEAETVVYEVIVLESEITSVKDVIPNEILIYPNPTNDVLNVTNQKTMKSIKLYDAKGKVLKTFILKENESKIEMKLYPAGIYFIQIDGGSKLHRLIKE